MLMFSGIPFKKFEFRDVEVGKFEKEPINLRTIIVGDQKLE
jgi:hypothetical protein